MRGGGGGVTFGARGRGGAEVGALKRTRTSEWERGRGGRGRERGEKARKVGNKTKPNKTGSFWAFGGFICLFWFPDG